MKTTLTKRVLSAILCIVLVAAVALFTTSCTDNKNEAVTTTAASNQDVTVLGEGQKQFTFTVTGYDSDVRTFEIHTDKETVGEALLEVGLIAGDEGPYGLYVKEVNGITADYEKDNAYWAFYIGSTLAPSSVDATEITEGETYAFMVTKS